MRFNVAEDLPVEFLRSLKEVGYSDAQIAWLMRIKEEEVTRHRKKLNIRRTYKMVDTCAAEFEAKTPYFYSTFDGENESIPSDKKKIVVLGSGPNPIATLKLFRQILIWLINYTSSQYSGNTFRRFLSWKNQKVSLFN